MSKCKADYKNLNHIQSFSEQSYATVQWARQVCQNDEWLRQQVEQLRYLTPPAIRKRYNIKDFFDKNQSYGCKVNGSEVGFDDIGPENITIDFTDMSLIDTAKSSVDFITKDNDDGESTHYCRLGTHDVNVPATNTSFGTSTGGANNSFWYVGYNKSKNYNLKAEWLKNEKRNDIPSVCRAQTFKAEASGVLTSIDLKLDYNGSKNRECASPLYVQIWKTYKKFTTKTVWNTAKKIMEYNYIKFSSLPAESSATSSQKEKGQYQEKYEDYQKYVKYQKKLKYTSGKKKGQDKYKDGKVLTETAYRKYNKDKDSGKILYVREREYVQWLGHNKKKADGTYYSDIYHPLAETQYTKVGNPWPNIQFEKPCEITKGETYAIVVFSPLSDWKHCPRWGGWGRNCKRDSVYPDGYAFMSEDNGRTWKRYGKNGADTGTDGKKLEYKKGKYTPQDFAFQCHVETKPAGTTTTFNDDVEYLYLKPILSNPIRTVRISAVDRGSDSVVRAKGFYVDYEVSTDGDDWQQINNTDVINFETDPELDALPTMLLVRAKLWTTDTTDTPDIQNIIVQLETNPAREMYARTAFHIPKTEPMLGANIWGRIYAPFVNESTVDCSLEIIQGENVSDHFNFVKLGNVDEKLVELELDYPEVAALEDENRAIYLTEHPEIITELKQKYTYIIPYTYEDKLYLLSFAPSYESDDMIITGTLVNSNTVQGEESVTVNEEDISSVYYDFGVYDVGGLSFSNEVAYPILSVRSQSPTPENSDGVDVFSEWIDYTFDYDSNQLFFKPSTLDDLVEGDLEITYNPVFLSGLSPDEVGTHIDEDTGLSSDGLILDYFKEKIIISDENIETRRVSLRAKPTDPIRQVYLYDSSFGEDSEPVELFEDKDFTFDIETNELVFPSVDKSNVVFGNGDILQIVYTPSLEDSRIALGYFARRTDTNMKVHIKDVYFEVKA